MSKIDSGVDRIFICGSCQGEIAKDCDQGYTHELLIDECLPGRCIVCGGAKALDWQQRQAKDSTPILSGYCKLLTERGVQYLCMPDNTKIPLQVDSITTNDVASRASRLTKVTVTCHAGTGGVTFENGMAIYNGDTIPHSFNASARDAEGITVIMFSTWAAMGDTIQQPVQYKGDVSTIYNAGRVEQ